MSKIFTKVIEHTYFFILQLFLSTIQSPEKNPAKRNRNLLNNHCYKEAEVEKVEKTLFFCKTKQINIHVLSRHVHHNAGDSDKSTCHSAL